MSAIPPDHRLFGSDQARDQNDRGRAWYHLLWTFEPACEPGLVLNERYQPPLGVAVSVNVALRGLYGAMASEKLNVTK
jgi:hypothetical protein